MFDFLKKKTTDNKSSSTTEKPQTSKKEALKGKDLASQEEALKPKEEPKQKGPTLGQKLGGALTSARDNLKEGAQNLERSIMKKLMPDEKAKEYWEVARMTTSLPLEKFLANYRGAWVIIAQQEQSMHELLFREAVAAHMDPKVIFERFIAVGAPDEINISGVCRKELAALAAKGDYKSMNFDKALKENALTMSDTYSRVSGNVEAMRHIFKRLSGYTAPPEIGGTF